MDPLNELFEKLAERGYGVKAWRNGRAGWLAELFDSETFEPAPDSRTWDYRPTATAAIMYCAAQLESRLAMRVPGP